MNSNISADITVKELFDRYPQLLQMFIDMELLCVGCPAEAFHTLVNVAREYRLDLNQLRHCIDKFVEEYEVSAGLANRKAMSGPEKNNVT